MSILVDLFGPGTWGAGGNVVVDVGGMLIGGLVSYLARDHIGRKLAAWWAKHHGPHAVEQQKQALREHEAGKKRGEY
jgi:hypothetical protein